MFRKPRKRLRELNEQQRKLPEEIWRRVKPRKVGKSPLGKKGL